MNTKYKKDKCPVCKGDGKIYVRLIRQSKFHKHRAENCPGCNGRRYLTVAIKEKENEQNNRIE